MTGEEVGKHSTAEDCWVVVHNEVYDFSCFFAAEPCYTHPGGNDPILKYAGKDGTEGFIDAGHKPGIAQR